MNHGRTHLPNDTRIRIRHAVDNALKQFREESGKDLPTEVRNKQIVMLEDRERQLLAAIDRVKKSIGFDKLCKLGCAESEIFRHVEGLIGLHDEFAPSWEEAVLLDRNKLKSFCIGAYTFKTEVEYLFTPMGESLVAPADLFAIKTLPNVIASLINALVELGDNLRERNRKLLNTDRQAVLSFLQYVRAHATERFPCKAVTEVLRSALADHRITEYSIKKLLTRHIPQSTDSM